MSLSRKITPSNDPPKQRYYIGRDKPKVEQTLPDRYYYPRAKAAKQLGRLPQDLEDEPDFDTLMDIDRI